MKLLFYNHTGQVSGAERMLLLILAGLNRDEFQASVICPPTGELAQLVEALAIPVVRTRLLEARFTWRLDKLGKYLKSFFQVIFSLRQEIIRQAPDLLHANSIRAGLVATTATLGTNIKVVWHIHDALPHHPLSTLIRWYAFFSSRTYLLAVSQAVARRFCGRVLAYLGLSRHLKVIHNGVELKRFVPDSAARDNVRRELTGGGEKLLVGIIGQITPRKGQLGLIRAFAKTAARLPQAILAVVGTPLFNNDHEYLLELQKTARALGIGDRVIFTGGRSDIPAIMQALDLLVVNSSSEPFGLVLLEAAASGTPVLATEVDGVPELITHQVSGWLVPVGNENQMADALVTLGCDYDLRSGLGEFARRYISSSHSAERYLKLLEDFYLQSVMSVERKIEHGASVVNLSAK